MLKRVAITGPESTGKSWLTKQLAMHYQTQRVDEYAREYLLKNGPGYNQDDVIQIAKGQLEREEIAAEQSRDLLFCDTDMLVVKIWAEVVFGQCPVWIEQQFNNHHYDLYLLCAPDIPWKPDPLRENPDNRDELFTHYEKTLIRYEFPYHIVTGRGNKRLKNAVHFVDEIL